MLPRELQSLVDICNAQPDNEGVFDALLSLLENASDSSIILDALSSFNPGNFQGHATQIERVSTLLRDADAGQAADQWESKLSKKHESSEQEDSFEQNVVKLNVEQANDSLDDTEISQIPGTTLDDVAGLQAVKKQIHRRIIRPFENPGLYERFKRRSGGGILMYGPPGCGKTMLARAVAGECKANFHEVRAAEILDKYQGVAEKRVIKVFERARTQKPSIIFFDEIEVLAHRRDYSQSGNMSTIISTLLREMDSVADENQGLLFLGATNVPWSIDPAFRRPGRFDRTIFVPPPDKIARAYLLRNLLKERPVEDGFSVQDIVKKSAGFSGADMEALVDTAIDYAIEESSSESETTSLSNAHFSEASLEIFPTIGDWLGQAKSFIEYANINGQYDDLKSFLKKHG